MPTPERCPTGGASQPLANFADPPLRENAAGRPRTVGVEVEFGAISAPPRPRWPVYNIGSGQDWGPRIVLWAEPLARQFPGFCFRRSDDRREVTIEYHGVSPRGVEDIGRIRDDLGYAQRYLPEAA